MALSYNVSPPSAFMNCIFIVFYQRMPIFLVCALFNFLLLVNINSMFLRCKEVRLLLEFISFLLSFHLCILKQLRRNKNYYCYNYMTHNEHNFTLIKETSLSLYCKEIFHIENRF